MLTMPSAKRPITSRVTEKDIVKLANQLFDKGEALGLRVDLGASNLSGSRYVNFYNNEGDQYQVRISDHGDRYPNQLAGLGERFSIDPESGNTFEDAKNWLKQFGFDLSKRPKKAQIPEWAKRPQYAEYLEEALQRLKKFGVKPGTKSFENELGTQLSIVENLRKKQSGIVTNPRPRKYASAAEKQAAFRARFPTLCVRVEPKTADTIQKIGDASGRSQQETMLSLVKFALTNRDFVNLGLTEHKQLPRIEEPRKANPMKRKPTPAQIAARERFAEMARSGAFKKKAAKARKNPAPLKMKIRGSETPDNPEGIVVTEAGALRFAKANMPADLKRAGFVPSVVAGARGWSINYGKAVAGHSSYKRNPRASNPINVGIKYACIMPEPGGMAYGIDERTPVTIRFSASELKRAYKCYLIPAIVRESAGFKRLIAEQKEVYMSLSELKQLFRSFI